jgi:hypothetical protein
VKGRSFDGVRVEASILARLLGIRLLKLDATVLVVPSDVTPTPAAPVGSRARTPAVPPGPASARSAAADGRNLADAVRSINEGAELLAEARRNGS